MQLENGLRLIEGQRNYDAQQFFIDCEAHRKTLFNYAKYLTGFHSIEEAEDLVQATILRAVLNREHFESGTNLKGWLITILHNLFVNFTQKSWRTLLFADVEKADKNNGKTVDLPDKDNYPIVSLHAMTTCIKLSATLSAKTSLRIDEVDEMMGEFISNHFSPVFIEAYNGVNQTHRTVFGLVCIMEFKYTEAAQILGIPLGTVMSGLSRARNALSDHPEIKNLGQFYGLSR